MKTLEEISLSHKYTDLPNNFYSAQAISQLQAPKLAGFNKTLATLFDLDPTQAQRVDFADYFNGIKHLSGASPIATLYAGHQFGHYVPQLGDGRALLLGELTNSAGDKWELQLKGGGPTPYSRNSDGRAVLRSTIREYLCSEAMHGLGIPTTRALCLFDSETPVYREQVERGALLVRAAESHLRFGSFEIFYHRGLHDDLKTLHDHVIKHYYPELAEEKNSSLSLLQTVIERTAKLIAQWQSVGFAHGVMNTDNMSILGLTIDYGPYGFLDSYDPSYICNHSDTYGRYAFDQQPFIAHWNCSALAQALIPFMSVDEAKSALNTFMDYYKKYYMEIMSSKLGLSSPNDTLVTELLELLKKNKIDYTYFYRKLCYFESSQDKKNEKIRDLFLDRESFDQWAEKYRQHLQRENSDDKLRREMMLAINPKYILRNYLAQQAIEKAEAYDYSMIKQLHDVLQSPCDEHPEYDHFAALPPDWAEEIVVSCSS